METIRKWTIEEMEPDHEPQHEQRVVITWNHYEDAPRVIPPVVLARLGETLVFEVKGNAKAEVHLPEPVFGRTGYLEIGPDDPKSVTVGTDRSALLPDGFMYAYTVEMQHLAKNANPGLLKMKAVGNSPPGMVLDDPNDPNPGPR